MGKRQVSRFRNRRFLRCALCVLYILLNCPCAQAQDTVYVCSKDKFFAMSLGSIDSIIFYPPQNMSRVNVEQDALGGTSSRLKVTVKTDTILIRMHLNQYEDLIQEYVRYNNDNYTPNATYIGRFGDSDEILLRNKIHETLDSTAPIFNASTVPWHLFMQHGYSIPKLIAPGHALTKDDIGSVWKDERDREYTLGWISNDALFMLPAIRPTEIEGVYTRDWEYPTSGYPSVLRCLSESVHREDITIKSGANYQIKPIQQAIDRKFYADDKLIQNNGTYICSEFVITETLICMNPFTVETWFPKPVMKDEMMRITQTFIFCGLSTSYNTLVDVKCPIMFESYGCNQAKHLMKYRDYDAYVFVPLIKKLLNGHRVDIPFISNSTEGASVWVLRNDDYLYDTDKLPDREISYLYHPTYGYKLGFASGLSLTEGLNARDKRLDYIPTDSKVISLSPPNKNKMYIKAINGEAFENNILPVGFKGEFHSYFSYFDPSTNVGQVYWYKDGDDYFIYAHCQKKNGKTEINLPTTMNGCQLEIIEKTGGVNLLSDHIYEGKLCVDYFTEDANYIVIKASSCLPPSVANRLPDENS